MTPYGIIQLGQHQPNNIKPSPGTMWTDDQWGLTPKGNFLGSTQAWHTPQGNIIAQVNCPWYDFQNYWFKITVTSLRANELRKPDPDSTRVHHMWYVVLDRTHTLWILIVASLFNIFGYIFTKIYTLMSQSPFISKTRIFGKTKTWLLMLWLLASPCHQQPWYCLGRICGSFCSTMKVFQGLCGENANALLYLLNKFSTKRVISCSAIHIQDLTVSLWLQISGKRDVTPVHY